MRNNTANSTNRRRRKLALPLVCVSPPINGRNSHGRSVKATATSDTQARRADRRSGVHALVRQVSGDLLAASERRNLGAFLTERLSKMVPVRSIRLNEITSTTPTRSLQPVRTRDYVAFAVPVKEPGRQLMLEAAFDQRGGPDDWTCQLLEAAASLAGILLEAERLGTTPARLTAAERDGAAPLIGSSEIMGHLRERVERVAVD